MAEGREAAGEQWRREVGPTVPRWQRIVNAMLSRGSWLLITLVLLFHTSVTAAAPTAQFWEELAGSASGPGISASVRGVVPEHRNVSVAIAPDGRPVVAYTDWDAIVVKRWTGAEWELVGVPGGGHVPQIAFDSRGRRPRTASSRWPTRSGKRSSWTRRTTRASRLRSRSPRTGRISRSRP